MKIVVGKCRNEAVNLLEVLLGRLSWVPTSSKMFPTVFKPPIKKPQLMLEVMLRFLLVTCRRNFPGKEPESEEGSWRIGLNVT